MTSESCVTSVAICTEISVCEPTSTSTVLSPIKLKTSVAPEDGTEMEYLPSASVTAPMVVPFTNTLTPGRLEPSSVEVMVPVMVRSCAHNMDDTRHSTAIKQFF